MKDTPLIYEVLCELSLANGFPLRDIIRIEIEKINPGSTWKHNLGIQLDSVLDMDTLGDLIDYQVYVQQEDTLTIMERISDAFPHDIHSLTPEQKKAIEFAVEQCRKNAEIETKGWELPDMLELFGGEWREIAKIPKMILEGDSSGISCISARLLSYVFWSTDAVSEAVEDLMEVLEIDRATERMWQESYRFMLEAQLMARYAPIPKQDQRIIMEQATLEKARKRLEWWKDSGSHITEKMESVLFD
jgi:hypothetical protein